LAPERISRAKEQNDSLAAEKLFSRKSVDSSIVAADWTLNLTVRTPLNAIINYLEIVMENPLDESTREIIEKASNASRSLVYVIDDLLNLTNADDGNIPTPMETFDLGATGKRLCLSRA
jgi:signal transduction histidine kinase